MIIKLYKQTILPRLCFIPYIAAKIIIFVFAAGYGIMGSRRKDSADSHLCIEAGIKGWESIEFKELYQSACEYLTPANVHRLIVKPDKNYLTQISNLLQSKPITHYLYDPRTDNSDISLWRGLWKSIKVAVLLEKHGVIPIVLLTDIAVRTWRAQGAVVSAHKGLVNCFMSPRLVGPIFPHSRLIGPSLMPFSVKMLQDLNELLTRRPENERPTALFTGSLYEPRTTQLEQIRTGLTARGFVIDIKGRPMGSVRVSDLEYWSRLCYSDIILTTAVQAIQKGTDWTHIPHFLYRYLEVLACGTLLAAPKVPGIRRYFTPGIHFVSFDSSAEAIEVLTYYLKNGEERRKIAKQGKKRAGELIKSRSFWVQIDTALGSYSMI